MAYDDIFVKGTNSRDDGQIIEVMLRDSTTGQGKTALTYSDVTCYYVRQGDASATAVTLCSATAGTYANQGAAGTGGGFVKVDDTNAPGVYQFSIPDAVLASGANSATLHFKASGVINKVVRILLTDQNLRAAALEASLQTTDGVVDSIYGLVSNIAITGAPAYEAAASFTKTTGGTEVGSYANTDTSNGTYHQIPDSGGTLDVYYQYALRPDEQAVSVVFKGRMSGSGDNAVVQAYDWIGAAWVTLFSLNGVNTSVDTNASPALVAKYTGTGGNSGLVRIRVYGTGLTSANAYIDQCVVGKTITSRTVGYSQGAIWVKAAGTAGAVTYVNGTADNPCPWANALTLSSALGMKRFVVTPATSITLDAALEGASVTGRSYSLAFGGQSISGSYFEGVENLTGTATCSPSEAIIVDCHLGAITIGEADFVRCHLMGTVTLSQASVPYRFHDCTGVSSAKIAFSAAGQTTVVSKVSGVLTIAGMVAGNTLYIDGDCDLTLDATNTGGTVYILGNMRLTNSGTGQTIIRDGNTTNITAITADYAKTGEAATAVTGLALEATAGAAQAAAEDAKAAAEAIQLDYAKTGEAATAVTGLALEATAGAAQSAAEDAKAAAEAIQLDYAKTGEAETAAADLALEASVQVAIGAATNAQGFAEAAAATAAAAELAAEAIQLDYAKTGEAEAAVGGLDFPTLQEIEQLLVDHATTAQAIVAVMDSDSTQLASIVADTNELQQKMAAMAPDNKYTAESHENVPTGSVVGGIGSGNVLFKWYEYEEGHKDDPDFAVSGVIAAVYSNADATGAPEASAVTDETGCAKMWLNVGTYYLFRRAAGRSFENPLQVTVAHTEGDSVEEDSEAAGYLLCQWYEYETGHDGDPDYAIADVDIRVFTNIGGTGSPLKTGRTTAAGLYEFYVPAGTYYLFRTKAGRTFTNPATFEVS